MNVEYDLIVQQWENLTLANDFLFGKIMSDKSLCTEMLKRILPHIDIGDINFPEVQKSFRDGIDTRGIRLDIYSKSDGKVYDVEIQTTNEKNLARRSRAYHIGIGNDILNRDTVKETHTYRDLPDAYVIFICTFDPFRQGRHIYTFENICCEDKNLRLNDGAVTIFLNAKGKIDDVSPELKAFLDLIMGRTSDDPFVREIEKQLEFAKHNSEWRRDFMMMSIHDQDKLIEGMDRGIAEGIAIGKAEAHQSMAIQMSREGLSVDMIARIVKESVSVIQGWIDEAKA
ncbi:MAG: Rpn family recombination-promoting nuclease/putative transposase [Synergistaceae bacterium]|nr:Rpn family recombination-promoting nuclease/putative transposase [Synergistaceae bacterium]